VGTFDADFDVKITLGPATRKLRLLTLKGSTTRTRGSKAWSVREPTYDTLPPFQMKDWSWGGGLLQFTPQTDRPGHTLRYSDGFGVDTSDGIAKHGPLVTNVGAPLAEAPLDAVVLGTKFWILTQSHLYSWDGTTLKDEWTNGSADNKGIEVYKNRIFISAYGANYYWTPGTGAPITVTTTAIPASIFLAINTQLWRMYSGNLISSSEDPEAVAPTWTTGIVAGDGDTVTNLFSVAGLLGIATYSSLYVVNSNLESLELNKVLRYKRSSLAFCVKSESGGDVWFSDRFAVTRLLVGSTDSFVIRPEGPFLSWDERPVTTPFNAGYILGICQDVAAVYIAVTRGAYLYVYKGVPVTADIYVWTPVVRVSGASANYLCAVAQLSGDSYSYVYFSVNKQLKRFPTTWSTYCPDWELETPYFTANEETVAKLWHKIRVYLERQANTTVTVYYRLDNTAAWTQFGTSAMHDDGYNYISLPATPLAGRRFQLKFAGNTTNSANKVDLQSFALDGMIKPDRAALFDFTVIADNKGDADFLVTLRTDATRHVAVVDRFGVTRTMYVLPGYPIETEDMDEARQEPVRVYQIVGLEVI
jgi:hypothetical protein